MAAPTILVFDSGLGGLTVFSEVVRLRPDARYVYAADDAFFPYGAHESSALRARVLEVMAGLIQAHAPDLIVVACNTASTIVLPDLRAQFNVPFVGTVPAIKPACAASQSKLVSVLGTQATVQRDARSRSARQALGQVVDCLGFGREHDEPERVTAHEYVEWNRH